MLNFFRNLFRSKHSKSQKKSSKKEKANEEQDDGIHAVFTPFDPDQAIGIGGNLDDIRNTELLENRAHKDRSKIRQKVRPPTFLHNRQAVVLKNERIGNESTVETTKTDSKSLPENSLVKEESNKEIEPNTNLQELGSKSHSPVNSVIEEQTKADESGNRKEDNTDDDSNSDDKGRKSFSENNDPIPVVNTSVILLAEDVHKEEDRIHEQNVTSITVEEKIINQIDEKESTQESGPTVVAIDVYERKETLSTSEDEKSVAEVEPEKESETEAPTPVLDQASTNTIEISSSRTSEIQQPNNTVYDNITIKQPVTKAPSFSQKSRQMESTVELREPKSSMFNQEEEQHEDNSEPVVRYREKSVVKSSVEEEPDTEKPAWVAMALKRSSIWKDPDEESSAVNPSKDENVENKPPNVESSENKPRTKPAINKPKPSFIPKDTAEEPLFQKNQGADIVKPSDLRKTKSIKAAASPRLNRQSAPAVERPLEENSTETNAKQTGKPSRVSSLTKKWESVR
ncbi:DgyrCDS1160 [Dimorphilus gyrociliatus]|uniref:DgyrCDS1160 n=1 Tax=Dimorphilus gyrociliatus TaxID=2664684 RepID=A0A7I8V6R3_9ANNE|nr:DgyrCDS1160 [Dimorphilus gyrociliatus]